MQSSSARRVALLLLLALSPLAAMATFGFRAIAAEEREAVAQATAKARRAELRVDRILAARLEQLRLDFEEEFVDLPSVSAAGDRLQALARRQPDGLVRLPFVVDGADLLREPEERPYPMPAPIPRSELADFRALVATAQEAENSGATPEAVVALLRASRTLVENQQLREILGYEIALVALRGTARKDGLEKLYAELASEQLLELYRESPGARNLDGHPIALQAWMELSELCRDATAPLVAPQLPLAALARSLIAGRWLLSPSQMEHSLREAIRSLKTLRDERRDQPERRAEALGIARVIDDLEIQRKFHGSFSLRVLPELRLATAEDSVELGGRPFARLLSLTILGQHRLFLVAILPRGEEPAPLVGVELNLRPLALRVAAELPELSADYEVRMAVAEGESLIAGDGALVVQPPQPGSSPLPGSEGQLGRPLIASLPSWRAIAAPAHPEAPSELARRRRWVYGAVVLSCLLAAFVSGLVAIRALDREVALARLRSELVRTVSHELRTPVAALRMLAEILQDGGLPRPRELQYFDRISGAAKRLELLIEKVLSLSQIEQGAFQIEAVGAPLEPAITRFLGGFGESEAGRGGGVELIDQVPGGWAVFDPEALDLILSNLLSNAVKYGAGEPIRVTIRRSGKCLEVSVRDRGRGLTEEARRSLFTPFYRAQPEDNAAPGIGIGLTIAKELAARMEARLWAAKVEGPGADFVLSLPGAEPGVLAPDQART